VLTGLQADGTFKTSAAQTYPTDFCRALADSILQAFVTMEETGSGPDPGGRNASPASLAFPAPRPGRSREQRKKGSRVRAPPLSGVWLPVSRWHCTYFGKWRETEHTNIQELRALVGLLRHLARSTSWWCSRVLILVDSMVALGSLAKGRSSSPPLLRLCRQAAAVIMAMDIRPMLRYIPSEVNPADGPSRGLPVGAAPETVLAHADRNVDAGIPAATPSEAASLSLLRLGRSCAGFAGG
jgi:hypothetical protein